MTNAQILQQYALEHKDKYLEEAQKMIAEMPVNEIPSLVAGLLLQIEIEKEKNIILRRAKFGPRSEVIDLDIPEDSAPLSEEAGQEDLPELTDLRLKEQLARIVQGLNSSNGELDPELREMIGTAISILKGSLPLTDHQPSSKNRRSLTQNPDEVVRHEPKEPFLCEHCGKEMICIGQKSFTQLEYTAASFKVIKHVYSQYRCPDDCLDEEGRSIIKSTCPENHSLVAGSPATPKAVAGVACEKLIMGSPLSRIAIDFKYRGEREVTRQTMCNWLMLTNEQYLIPVIEKMNQDLLKQQIIHMDETPLKCREFKNRKESCVVGAVSGRHEKQQMTLFFFFETHEQKFVREILGDHYSNVLMSDGAKAYANYKPPIHLGCNAHARRRFFDALKIKNKELMEYLKLSTKEERKKYLKSHRPFALLLAVIEDYSDLCYVERCCHDLPVEKRLEMRQLLSTKIFDRLCRDVEKILEGFEEKSAGYKAADYFIKRKKELGRFLENGKYPLDNNLGENSLRRFVLDRRNFLFSNTERGAQATMNFLSVLQSAIMNGLDPYGYLVWMLETLQKEGSEPEIIEKILPYSSEIPERLRLDNDKGLK